MAIEQFTRSLSAAEKRVLSRTLSREQRRLQLMLGRVVIFESVAFGALWALTILAVRHQWLLVTAFWATIGMAVSFWAYRDARRDVSAKLLRILSEEMVEIEEVEDEGARYAFQVNNEEIVFISGQDYYPSAQFPNSDFCVIELLDGEGKILEEVISKKGKKLKPVRTIPAAVKRNLRIPDHMQRITARIEDLEILLGVGLEAV